jgi:aspartyl-tRNA(Asn)/glutamyl-tRNA(Gln) amidotransferase subunit A
VQRLREAGAVILGKTNTPELALSGHTDNLVFGSTGNPWNSDLSPGGSSGGAAAAVGSGCGPLAIATDAGGSIRRPASHAGVAGLKPGIGRVPRRYGFPPLAHDLQVVGPMARCVSDLRAAFGLMATPASRPPAPASLRIAFFGRIGDAPVEPAMTGAFEHGCAVLRGMGHRLEEIAPPWDVEEVNRLFGALASTGVARVVSQFPGWRDLVTPAIAQQAEAGLARSGVEYARDLEAISAFRWRMADVLASFDIIATPAAAALAWPRSDAFPKLIGGEEAGPRGAAIFSTAVNLAGLPAIVVPGRTGPGGLPAGLQLIGGMGAEELLLDAAEAFEAASPWPRIAPDPG